MERFRTRDNNGRYIPKCPDDSKYLEKEVGNIKYKKKKHESQVYLNDDGTFSDIHCEYEKKKEKKREGKKSPNSYCKIANSEIELKEKRIEKKGYKPFSFPLSAPINNTCRISLPNDYNYKSIHVENAFLKTNQLTFQDSFSCDPSQPSFNQILFTEGLIVNSNILKLTTGECVEVPKTWTPIDSFSLINPVILNSDVDYYCQIRLCIPFHNILGKCQPIYLLETCNAVPNDLQYVPFQIDNIVDCNTIIASPQKVECKTHIPSTFNPTMMLLLPPLGPCQISDFLTQNLCNSTVISYNSTDCEYVVQQKCPNRIKTMKKILTCENPNYIAKIPNKKYTTAQELYPEIQRSMNPLLVTPESNTIIINDIPNVIEYGEYENIIDFCSSLEDIINNNLGWVGCLKRLVIGYNFEKGEFNFIKSGPFSIEFGANSLQKTLGFNNTKYAGNNIYASDNQVFFINVTNNFKYQSPSNRYISSYDSINDVISIRSISRVQYLILMIPGYVVPEGFGLCNGDNFVIPFEFLCDSPFTNYLDFSPKLCGKEYNSAFAVTKLLGPPSILYMVIPEITNEIVVTPSGCCDSNFKSAMAILYLQGSGNTYKTKCCKPCKDICTSQNVEKPVKCLSILFYTDTGVSYYLNNMTGVINFKLCV